MSPSALHRHFKYQKHLRLQEARRFMLGEALDAAEASAFVTQLPRAAR